MKVGDLVTWQGAQFKGRVGIILSIVQTKEEPPDYRRPDQYSVYWGLDLPVGWFWRNELRVINANW